LQRAKVSQEFVSCYCYGDNGRGSYQSIIRVRRCKGSCCLCCKLIELGGSDTLVDTSCDLLCHQHLSIKAQVDKADASLAVPLGRTLLLTCAEAHRVAELEVQAI
jgi:hypothetical protein